MSYYVCYVEDHAEIGQDISAYLQAQGYYVDRFSDGLKAQSEIQIKHYDLLILDIMLPGIDGYAIAQQSKKKHPNTPIIMTTAK